MDTQRLTSTLKPVAAGAVGGILVAAAVGFSMNWVYTAGALQHRVNAARVSALAEICETQAYTYWTEQKGMQVAELEGWGNERRQKLAQRFAPEVKIPGQDLFREDVVDACDDALRPA